jgi:D-arabinose 1-dehydrogenase-like Zn-dependent alcohol dehydrogenase
MTKTKSYAAYEESGLMSPFEFGPRKMNENDVVIDILYCGVCHSDLHR